MSFSAPEELHTAILENSYSGVEAYVAQGAVSVNLNHASMLNFYRSRDNKPCTVVLSNDVLPSQAFVSTLHMAVCNCFNRNCSDQHALSIVSLLVKSGANVHAESAGIEVVLKEVAGWCVLAFSESVSPFQLATLLKRRGSKQEKEMMKKVEDLLRPAQQSGVVSAPKTISLSHSVFDAFNNNLLFSEKSSDIKFVCRDGTVVFAHKLILSAASDCFANYFGEHPDRTTWKTSYSPEIVRAFLTFIYTGHIPSTTMDKHALDLLPVAQECFFPALVKLCEASLFRTISIDSIKDVLVLSYTHNITGLVNECFTFVKRNAIDVLTEPNFAALATESPDLWQQLRAAITENRNHDD
jgi:hypothetical protein